jgi:hypothetical protein
MLPKSGLCLVPSGAQNWLFGQRHRRPQQTQRIPYELALLRCWIDIQMYPGSRCAES